MAAEAAAEKEAVAVKEAVTAAEGWARAVEVAVAAVVAGVRVAAGRSVGRAAEWAGLVVSEVALAVRMVRACHRLRLHKGSRSRRGARNHHQLEGGAVCSCMWWWHHRRMSTRTSRWGCASHTPAPTNE